MLTVLVAFACQTTWALSIILSAISALFAITNSAFACLLHGHHEPHASYYRASIFRFPSSYP